MFYHFELSIFHQSGVMDIQGRPKAYEKEVINSVMQAPIVIKNFILHISNTQEPRQGDSLKHK